MSGPAYGDGISGNEQTALLANGKTVAQQGLTSQEEIDSFNKMYLAEQQRQKDAATGRQKTVDILSTNQGRDATILSGKGKGIL